MSLSQAQIIRSLGEALAWFEKELAWGVEPAELRHLTGRIGELYAAMITRGQMALTTNQRGYDVVSAEGHKISVKTVTTSNHVSFRRSTLSEVGRVIILRLNVSENEVSIEEILDRMIEEFRAPFGDFAGDYVYSIPARDHGGTIPLEEIPVALDAVIGRHKIIQYENGTIVVETDGIRSGPAKPILREIAREHGIPLVNGSGNQKNTRQLGAEVIAALRA